ncbi:MAG TPA: hypothetical protein VNQ79_06000 [Blastocatellia bacterium]|nr:hypothetical protein [Blastocatellia bacterium]
MSLREIFYPAGAVLAAILLITTSLTAAPGFLPVTGRTSVVLSSDFLTAASALGIAPGAITEGSVRSGIASFPITGGVIDLASAKGEINHSGGLSLTRGGTQVQLLSFNIDTTGAAAVLTGLVVVNGNVLGRVPLFNLGLPALALPLRPEPGNVLFIPGVRVTLTAEAAGALNTVFNLNAFVQGFNIGTASVYAVGEGSRQRRFFGERSISDPDSSGNDQDENERGIRRDQ